MAMAADEAYPGPRVLAVAVSGGRDSTALLHSAWRQSRGSELQIVALHVHHGLMPAADRWQLHLERQCARWRQVDGRLSLRVVRLAGQPGPGDSIEAWARRERYLALAAMAREVGAAEVWLAHHRRDQAETVLLQALRGAGASGLSAMASRFERHGVRWVRPWLDQPAQRIQAYLTRYRLSHIDDDSNADVRFARNRLRHQVMPAFLGAFPHLEQSLVDVARQAQAAAELQDEIAQGDLLMIHAVPGQTLPLPGWLALSPVRRRFALRQWLKQGGAGAVSEAMLQRLLDELPSAPSGAQWSLPPDWRLRLYRGQLGLMAGRAAPAQAGGQASSPLSAPLKGCGLWPLEAWLVMAEVTPVCEGGIEPCWLIGARWRNRLPGDQFQSAPGACPRSLKKQFQAAGIPSWQRQGPVLVADVTRGAQMLYVPGLGVDARVRAPSGREQWQIRLTDLA